MQNVTQKNSRFKDKGNSLNTNKSIKAKEVRLVNDEGEMLGIMPIEEALKMAQDASLDLVEINAANYPPLCRLTDYGKFKYLQQKKQHDAKKKQKKVIVKHLFIHLNIAVHDYDVKIKQISGYFQEGKIVELAVELRGREMEYSEKAKELLARFYADLGGETVAKLNNIPRLEGRRVSATFAPVVASLTKSV